MGKLKFTDNLFNEICELIATSDKGLVSICKKKGINAVTFYDWISKSDELANRYTRAREIQADYLADQIIQLSSRERFTTTETNSVGGEGGSFSSTTKSDNYHRTRLEIDARKWKASKLYPKKYGEKIDLTSEGKALPATIINLGSGLPPKDEAVR